MTHDRQNARIEELEGLLDTYGSDTSRWPQAARARTEGLLGPGGAGARLMAEAKALDAVLARAPLPSAERRSALVERIMAEASAPAAAGDQEQGVGRPSGVVIPWPGARGRGNGTPRPATAAPSAASWRAAGLLAASLALGVFIGALDLAPAPVDQLVEAVDYSTDLDQMAASMAGDGLSALDEDLL